MNSQELTVDRRYGLLILLTVLIVLASTHLTLTISQRPGLPFSINVVNARTAVIEPIPGIPLPSALRAGDQIDLAALPRATRIAIIITNGLSTLSPRQTYMFVIRRGNAAVTIPIRTERLNAASSVRAFYWSTLGFNLLLAAVALLTLWRGRGRAAAGLAFWAVAFLVAYDAGFVPSHGVAGLGLMLGAMSLILLARVGFYVMAESMVGVALSPRARTWWRASFALLLGLGAIHALGGPLAFVATGWAELMRPAYGVALSASYLVPVALLFVSYRRAVAAQRLRLRWMLWSSVLFCAGIFLSNTPIFGFFTSTIAQRFTSALAIGGFLYAILRHRVVDVAVFLNRALVYAATTSLLLGLLALLESLIERTTLGRGAGLLLEFAVPVGLGAALSAVHRRIESTLEQFLFRRQYREDTALRGFARDCAFVTQPDNLLDLTVDQIRLHTDASWVALYECTPAGFVLTRQRGSRELPMQLDLDDLVLVTLRAHATEVDLNGTPSTLGREGYVFPLRVRDRLLGMLVVGPRSDEHYVADERELFAHVTHEVAAALSALRTQETEERAQASEALLDEARTRNATLLELLRAHGVTLES